MCTKIYLAARYSRREELCGYRQRLQACGFLVTSRWLNGDHQVSDQDMKSTSVHRQRFAREDWDDLISSETVISFTEEPRSAHSRGGRHVEFGMALAYNKRVIVIGHLENVFHFLPDVEFYETFDDLDKVLLPQTDPLNREDVFRILRGEEDVK